MAGVRFPGWLLPGQRAGLWRVFVDVLLNGPDRPIGKRDDPFTVIFRQGEYVPFSQLLYLASEPDGLVVKVEVFERDTK